MMVVAIVALVVLLNWARKQNQQVAALRYQYKYEALKDRLAQKALSGEADRESEGYQFLDSLLGTMAEQLPSMNNIWALVAQAVAIRGSRDGQEDRLAIESQIMNEPGCGEIYMEAHRLWEESIRERYKYSIFAAGSAILPLVGLVPLCQRYRTQADNRKIGRSIKMLAATCMALPEAGHG